MDVLAILKQLGIGVFLEWGKEREELEDRIGQQRTKYMVILGIIIAADIAVYVIGSRHILPDPLPFVALFLAVSVTAIATILSLRLQEHFGVLRQISDDFLNGKIPVAVAAFTVKTLPGTIIVLLRFGGTENVHEYRITTESDLVGALGTYFGNSQDKYVIVGCRERGHLGTVQDLENFLRTDVLAWLAHRTGGKLLLPPPYLLEELRLLELKNTVLSPTPG